MPALTDLRQLLGVILHPLRWWRAWRSLAGQLFLEGGVAIDTPPAAEGQPIDLRTLIQPDGDVLVLVRDGWEPDAGRIADHLGRVARWYDESRTVVLQSAGALRAVVMGVSVGAAGGSGWTTLDRLDGITGLAAALGVSAGLFGALRLGLGRLGSILLRRRIDRWLGGAVAP
jgi:hypothetical protein